MVSSRVSCRAGLLLLTGICLGSLVAPRSVAARASSDDFLIVHCLLPGQLRQLGRRTTYVSARRPARTSALDCQRRGGEYVRQGVSDAGSAIALWLDQARGGDSTAQTILGDIFEQGPTGTPDYESARHWYEQAARQGHAPAQIALGTLLERGLGGPEDSAAALHWYQEAAGLPTAQAARFRLDDRGDVARHIQPTAEDPKQVTVQLETALARLQETEQMVDAKGAEIARLQQQLQTHKAQAATRPAASQAPPTIAIVTPTLTNTTRGLVKVAFASAASAATEQVLIGRVDAPAGLLSLTVNGIRQATNSAGVFEAAIAMKESQQTVTVTAVDQSGQRSDLQFTLAAQSQTALQEASSTTEGWPPDLVLGSYHALLIGNERYAALPHLETPIRDVRRLGAVLKKRYGFQVQTLENATRFEILSALNRLRATLTNRDNLLIYYAGHGEIDQANARGHWLPVDATPDSTANWVSNVSVTDILNVMQARQVMLVADSCYSGTLTRSAIAELGGAQTREEQISWLRAMASKRSRVVLTSGGLAPVLDFGGGDHSVFAEAFIDTLTSNNRVIAGRALHQAVAARVAHRAAKFDFQQLPEYAPIGRAGHEAGDFVLLPLSSR